MKLARLIMYVVSCCVILHKLNCAILILLNLCRTTQQELIQACIICTGVVWLGSPAAIALSLLGTNEAICKLTAWYILIPVRVLLVSYMVCIN